MPAASRAFMQVSWFTELSTEYTRTALIPSLVNSGISRAQPAASAMGSAS